MRWMTAGTIVVAALACAASLAQTVKTSRYTYDQLGRLTSVTYGDGVVTNYRYDDAGNRSQYTSTALPPPVSSDSSITVAAGSVNNPVPLGITGGPPASVAVSTNPDHGVASVYGAGRIQIRYTPTPDFTGPDFFQFTATNPSGTSAPATVSITVSPLSPRAP